VLARGLLLYSKGVVVAFLAISCKKGGNPRDLIVMASTIPQATISYLAVVPLKVLISSKTAQHET
jgi:hypothetical protein